MGKLPNCHLTNQHYQIVTLKPPWMDSCTMGGVRLSLKESMYEELTRVRHKGWPTPPILTDSSHCSADSSHFG
ncbi:hypothetical protein Hanom_Chr14g01294651 [Helianthus anomalus]